MLKNIIALQVWKPTLLQFICLDRQGKLVLYDHPNDCILKTFHLLPLDFSKHFTLHVSDSHVCLTETYGLHAQLIDLASGEITPLSREDYYSKHTKYSMAFITIQDKPCLIHQTQWNRLDILCLTTRENLTNRVLQAEITEVQTDARGNPLTIYERDKDIDFFHSGLIVSPDHRYFLSNGWIWQPVDRIYAFPTSAFLKKYESTFIQLPPQHAKLDDFIYSGYNWDRPWVFLNNQTILIASDAPDPRLMDPEDTEAASYVYHQFCLYQLPESVQEDSYQQRLSPSHSFHADIFPLNADLEVQGDLYFDELRQLCIAIYEQGMKVFDLNGNIHYTTDTIFAGLDKKDNVDACLGYTYDANARIFYTFDNTNHTLMTIALDDLLMTDLSTTESLTPPSQK